MPASNPPLAWVATIQELDDAQVIRALDTIRKGGYEYWPSLPEFVKASKGLAKHQREDRDVGPRYLGVPISDADRKQLEYKPKRDPANSMRQVNELQALLGRPPKYTEEQIQEAENAAS